jgi:cobalt-precorrin 5A hydrolase
LARIALVAITEEGLAVAQRIKSACREAELFVPQELSKDDLPATLFTEPLRELVGRLFGQYEGLVLVMALGIVVRLLCPRLKDKYTDPAVVVVDDAGRFVISTLSGHEGGANELALRVANALHAEAVITTGTEARKDIIVGLGCRADVSAEAIRKAILSSLEACGVPKERVRLVATIEERAKVQGLLKGVEELGIPLKVLSKEEIGTCAKDYERSSFVKEKMGIWGVCEPAALLAGRKTRLILRKQKFPGVTVAVAQENLMW